MQVKTTMRYYFIPIRNAIYKKQKTSVGEDMENLGFLYCWWEYKHGVATVENSTTVSLK